MAGAEKIPWTGRLVGVQPRIRLMRSFDERSHSYLGYVLRVEGTIADKPGEFIIAIGKAAQAKHCFLAGMEASGQAVPVPDPQPGAAGFYKASGLTILKDAEGDLPAVRPFHGEPPLTRKSIAAAGIAVWTLEPTTLNARPVSGPAGCRWR